MFKCVISLMSLCTTISTCYGPRRSVFLNILSGCGISLKINKTETTYTDLSNSGSSVVPSMCFVYVNNKTRLQYI